MFELRPEQKEERERELKTDTCEYMYYTSGEKRSYQCTATDKPHFGPELSSLSLFLRGDMYEEDPAVKSQLYSDREFCNSTSAE